MKHETIRRTQRGLAWVTGLVTLVFMGIFAGSSLFADSSRDNKRKQKSKTKACHIKCPPVRGAKDIRRHAACIAKRAKICR